MVTAREPAARLESAYRYLALRRPLTKDPMPPLASLALDWRRRRHNATTAGGSGGGAFGGTDLRIGDRNSALDRQGVGKVCPLFCLNGERESARLQYSC